MSVTGIGEIASAVSDIVDKFFPDKTQAEKDALAAQLAQLQASVTANTAQSDVDKVEAGSANLFVSGWRPFVGWVCGVGCAVSFLGPLISYIAGLCGHVLVFPNLDTGTLMTLLGGLLGLGSLRTYEKTQGVNQKHG